MNDFNFFEPYIYTKKSLFRPSYIVVIFIILLSAIYSYNLNIEMGLKSDNDMLLEDIASLEAEGYLNELRNLNAIRDSLLERINEAETFNLFVEDNYVINYELILNVTSLIPDEMYFSNWSFTSNQISMSGFSYDRTTIAEYEAKLRNFGYENIHINSITEATDSGTLEYQFDLSFELGGTDDENE